MEKSENTEQQKQGQEINCNPSSLFKFESITHKLFFSTGTYTDMLF